MSCQNINTNTTQSCENNNSFVIVLVLYILLAIILGAWMSC